MTRTGETAAPDGKRTRVELRVDDGLLCAVTLDGDFRIDPPTAVTQTLARICVALEGVPADIEVVALAARVRAAVPIGVTFVGSSPMLVACAVRDALSEVEPVPRIGAFTPAHVARLTQSWRDLPWRIVPESPLSAVLNVALDEVISDGVGAGVTSPTLRFWGWSETAVIIGRTQSLGNEIDIDFARDAGVRIVRRMTGGGAMFIQPAGAITYSIALPDRLLTGLTVRASYEVCDAWVVEALREVGIDAHHVPVNDIACADGKIGGAAQARRRGAVLHHTTLAYKMDDAEMLRVLRLGRERVSSRGTASASKRVSPLIRQTSLSRKVVVAALQSCFMQIFGGSISPIDSHELADAELLAAGKYDTPEWTEEFP